MEEYKGQPEQMGGPRKIHYRYSHYRHRIQVRFRPHLPIRWYLGRRLVAP